MTVARIFRPRRALGGAAATTFVVGAALLVTASPSTAFNQANRLPNPNFATVGPGGPYTLDNADNLCASPPDAQSNLSAAQGWSAYDQCNGSGSQWTETDLVRSTLPRSGRYMLHVSGGNGSGVVSSGAFSISTGRWSISIDALSEPVAVCLERIGDPGGMPTSCAIDSTLGQWTQVRGSYSQPSWSVNQLLIADCQPGNVFGGDPVLTCPTADAWTPALGISAQPGYTDFYVAKGSITGS